MPIPQEGITVDRILGLIAESVEKSVHLRRFSHLTPINGIDSPCAQYLVNKQRLS